MYEGWHRGERGVTTCVKEGHGKGAYDTVSSDTRA
jgi:hypothetical protein